jgi:hypothetical protein
LKAVNIDKGNNTAVLPETYTLKDILESELLRRMEWNIQVTLMCISVDSLVDYLENIPYGDLVVVMPGSSNSIANSYQRSTQL